MPKKFTSKTQKIGETGENIATRFLMKHGFQIIERNYTKKWGEIDIIAKKKGKIYFVEVKSVSCETIKKNVSPETPDAWRPEDNMHPWKLKRIYRAIQTYILSKKLEDLEWQLDLLVVYLDLTAKKARVRVIEDIVL